MNTIRAGRHCHINGFCWLLLASERRGEMTEIEASLAVTVIDTARAEDAA
jgi:hypothetical protein